MNTIKLESIESFDIAKGDIMEAIGISDCSLQPIYKDTQGNICIDTYLTESELAWVLPNSVSIKGN